MQALDNIRQRLGVETISTILMLCAQCGVESDHQVKQSGEPYSLCTTCHNDRVTTAVTNRQLQVATAESQQTDRVEFIVDLLIKGYSVRKACGIAAVKPSQLTDWMNADPDVMARINTARYGMEPLLISTAKQLTDEPKTAIGAIKFLSDHIAESLPGEDVDVLYSQSVAQLPKLLKAQQKVADDPSDKIALHCGRQSGKTFFAHYLMSDNIRRNKDSLYLVPLAAQTDICWSYLKDTLPHTEFNFNETKKQITYRDQSPGQIELITSHDPDSARGRNTDLLIIDEFQMQRKELWEKVAPSLVSQGGRVLIIMTPPDLNARSKVRSEDLMYARTKFAEWEKSPDWSVHRFSSYHNGYNDFDALEAMKSEMPELAYRQEVLGEIVTADPEALWLEEWIQCTEPLPHSDYADTVVAVDPAITTSGTAGIVVSSKLSDEYRVRADFSAPGRTPKEWAEAAISAYFDYNCTTLLVEDNQGGEMNRDLIHQLNPQVNVQLVKAQNSKGIRARPIASLYQQGLVAHESELKELTNELLMWRPDNSNWSPNRLDALVWGLLYLSDPSLIGAESIDRWI